MGFSIIIVRSLKELRDKLNEISSRNRQSVVSVVTIEKTYPNSESGNLLMEVLISVQ